VNGLAGSCLIGHDGIILRPEKVLVKPGDGGRWAVAELQRGVKRVQFDDFCPDQSPRFDQIAAQRCGQGIAMGRVQIKIATADQQIIGVGRLEDHHAAGAKHPQHFIEQGNQGADR